MSIYGSRPFLYKNTISPTMDTNDILYPRYTDIRQILLVRKRRRQGNKLYEICP